MRHYECLMQVIKKLKEHGRYDIGSRLHECFYKEETTENSKIITLNEGNGYSGFIVEFHFDKEGNTVSHACWE